MKKNYIIIFILIILFLLFSNIKCKEIFANTKPYIWLYWDNVNDTKTPAFIELCRETVYKNCSKQFNIVLLNKDNIESYLPELKTIKNKMEKLIIAHKVDIYRIMLLYKYGGIYLDSDIIIMKDLSDIIKKLEEYDFVGFGCTGVKCKNGYGSPSNWALASRPGTTLMKNIFDKQLAKLDSNKIEYHTLGKMAIWETLGDMITAKQDGYKYYHYMNTIDGT
jgi:hypothetical protein